MLLSRQPPSDAAAFRGPAYGLMAISIMPGLIAFFVLQSLVPVVRNGTGVWLASILPVMGSAGLLLLVFMTGLLGRRAWYSAVAQPFAWTLMGAYALSFAFGLAVFFGRVPRTSPDLAFVNTVNVVLWLLLSPANLLLWRLTHREAWRRLPPKARAL